MIDRENWLTKAYEKTPLAELLEAPLSSLQGLSKARAAVLHKAFQVNTIGELGRLKYGLWAREICAAADNEKKQLDRHVYKERLDKKYESVPAEKLATSPVHALQGVSKGDAVALARNFRVKTIREFAEFRFLERAQAIVAEAEPKPVSRGVRSRTSVLFGAAALVALALLFIFVLLPAMNQEIARSDKDPSPGKPTMQAQDKQKPPAKDTEKQQAGKQQAAAKQDGNAKGTYRVQKGDTLSRLSVRLLGSANKWRELYQANKEKIKDPNRIFPGQELNVPR